MPRNNQALLLAAVTAGIGAVVNLLTSVVEPELIESWWWALVPGLAVLVYVSAYGIQRRIGSLRRLAACAPRNGPLHLFGITANGRLVSRRFNGGAWSRWQRETFPGADAHDVTAMTATRDLLEIYVADSEGVVWTRALGRDGRSWSAWESLDSSGELGPVAAVAACSGSPDWRELTAVGVNGRVAHRWRQDGHPWHAWHLTGLDDAETVALTSVTPGNLECFAVDHNGELRHRYYRGGWSEWGSFGRPQTRTALKAVAVVSGKREHMEAFVLDTEGHLAHRWYRRDPAWSPWADFPAPPGPVADIAAVATAPGNWRVIAVTESGDLWQRLYPHGSHWSDWERIS